MKCWISLNLFAVGVLRFSDHIGSSDNNKENDKETAFKEHKHCHRQQLEFEDVDSESEYYSEYSDDEDVPLTHRRSGFKIWDYFYIQKVDVNSSKSSPAFHKLHAIYKKSSYSTGDLLQKYIRLDNTMTFYPSRFVSIFNAFVHNISSFLCSQFGIFIPSEKDRFVKVKARVFYSNRKLLYVKVMDIAEIAKGFKASHN